MKSFFRLNRTIEEYLSKGNDYYNEGRYEQAIRTYEKIVNNPHFAEALYNIGKSYSAMGDYMNAIKAYSKTLKIAPKHVNAMKALNLTLKIVEK